MGVGFFSPEVTGRDEMVKGTCEGTVGLGAGVPWARQRRRGCLSILPCSCLYVAGDESRDCPGVQGGSRVGG